MELESHKRNSRRLRQGGCQSPKRYQMKDVSRIRLRVDYFKRLIQIIIEFNDGQQIPLHDYQNNFVAARDFLIENLKNVHFETKFGVIKRKNEKNML